MFLQVWVFTSFQFTFSELLNRTWHVHSVGPLFEFRAKDLENLSPFLERHLPGTHHGTPDRVDIETVLGKFVFFDLL